MPHKAFDLSGYLPTVQKLVASELGVNTKIVRMLGSGGQGIVYQLFDTEANNSSALKIVALTDEVTAGRFRREVKALKTVSHQNLMTIYTGPCSFGIPDVSGVEFCYFTMPYAELGGLDKLQIPGDRRPWYGYFLYLFQQICIGVQALHSKGYVHRDLKPPNILFLDSEFSPVVSDFGLAIPMEPSSRWTKTDEKVGTRAYMAPEQEAGKAKTAELLPATDIYALGKILYFLLTGDEPREGPLPNDVLRPMSPHLGFADYIINRCTRPSPNDRYNDVLSLRKDIESAQGNLSRAAYLGLHPETRTFPRLVVVEEQQEIDSRQALLQFFQGNTHRALTIRPRQRMALRIRAAGNGTGEGEIVMHDHAIFLHEQDPDSGKVSITFSDQADASQAELRTDGILPDVWKPFGKNLVYDTRYRRRIHPYQLYKFKYSYRVPEPFGPAHNSMYLPITDYFGEVELAVESELPLLRARSHVFTFDEWKIRRQALDAFFDDSSSIREPEPIPVFTGKTAKATVYNPPMGHIFVLWWQYKRANPIDS